MAAFFLSVRSSGDTLTRENFYKTKARLAEKRMLTRKSPSDFEDRSEVAIVKFKHHSWKSYSVLYRALFISTGLRKQQWWTAENFGNVLEFQFNYIQSPTIQLSETALTPCQTAGQSTATSPPRTRQQPSYRRSGKGPRSELTQNIVKALSANLVCFFTGPH